jgi:alcohol dehydrogenase (NADP+)
VLVNVGAPAKPLSLNAFSLLTNGRSITGSMIGGITETREMLDFCARARCGRRDRNDLGRQDQRRLRAGTGL